MSVSLSGNTLDVIHAARFRTTKDFDPAKLEKEIKARLSPLPTGTPWAVRLFQIHRDPGVIKHAYSITFANLETPDTIYPIIEEIEANVTKVQEAARMLDLLTPTAES